MPIAGIREKSEVFMEIRQFYVFYIIFISFLLDKAYKM